MYAFTYKHINILVVYLCKIIYIYIYIYLYVCVRMCVYVYVCARMCVSIPVYAMSRPELLIIRHESLNTG